MLGYREKLEQFRFAATPSRRRILLLTGQSSFRSSRLTESQSDLLRALGDQLAAEPLFLGFPFHSALDVPDREPPLTAAALRNTWQYLWSRTDRTFQRTIARALQPWLDATCERLFVLTGSCGLQMLCSAWPELRDAGRLRVVALGPACWRPNLPDLFTIQGRSDYWSRLLYRGPVSSYCAGGHLDYWNSLEVRDLAARRFLA
jgi:hypothetical protein